MNYNGHCNPAAGNNNSGYQPRVHMSMSPQPSSAHSGGGQQQQHGTVFTCRDVLNGRGQGVQRHPGNIKYRTLVFVNKVLYAKCPRPDKMKISKGIVAAVREMGGGFLEVDERTGIYKDIGDKKATDKTSQALREGQTKIRKQMYKDEEKGGKPTYDTSFLTGPNGGPLPTGNEISAQGYFGYSVQVLDSLYNAEWNNSDVVRHKAAVQMPNKFASANSVPLTVDPNTESNGAMARAMEQFGGMIPVPSQPPQTQPQAQMPPPCPPLPPTNDANEDLLPYRFTGSGRTPLSGQHCSDRLTDMSAFSINSLLQLVEVAKQGSPTSSIGDQGRQSSILSPEIVSLIRDSQSQLLQVGTMKNLASNVSSDPHEDEELVIYNNEETMNDRVSELRFTDVDRATMGDRGALAGYAASNPRFTDYTESSGNVSLMDASLLTIPTDAMSVHTRADKQYKDGDFASAELLLRLSGDKSNESSHPV